MSFTLTDMGAEGFEFRANVWTWKAALEIIKSLEVISESKIRQMSYNATGVKIEQDEARLIGQKIEEKILPKLKEGERIYADFTITDKPDDGTFFRDEDENWKNYSADYQWLKEFSDFCRTSKGFQVF